MNEFKSGKKTAGILFIIVAIGLFIWGCYNVSREPFSYFQFSLFDLDYETSMSILGIAALVLFILGVIELLSYSSSKKEFYQNQNRNQAPPQYTQQNMYQQPNQYTNQPQQNTYQRPNPYPNQPQQNTYQRPNQYTNQTQQNTYQRPNQYTNQTQQTSRPQYTQQTTNSQATSNTWTCRRCGSVNQSYVSTCRCGEDKPR